MAMENKVLYYDDNEDEGDSEVDVVEVDVVEVDEDVADDNIVEQTEDGVQALGH
jgi:hypothetical protein